MVVGGGKTCEGEGEEIDVQVQGGWLLLARKAGRTNTESYVGGKGEAFPGYYPGKSTIIQLRTGGRSRGGGGGGEHSFA